MPSSYTSLLGLVLPVQGELQGTWGTTVNNELTSLLDTAIAGTTTLSVDADTTLTTTAGAANQARQSIIRWTASNGATTRFVTAPAQSKVYIVDNAGTGSIVFRGAGPTTGVTIIPGEACVVAWNGSDFVKIASENNLYQQDTSVNITDKLTSFTASVSPSTPFNVEGTVSGSTLTVTTIQGTGTIVVGAVVAGVGVLPGTTISAFGTGSGGTGTYTLSNAGGNSTAQTFTITYSTMTVTAVASGTIAVGNKLSNKLAATGTNLGIPVNTYITALGTGTGGAGTYILNKSFTLASSTIYGSGTITNTVDAATMTVMDGSGVSVRSVPQLTDYQGAITSGRMIGAYSSRTAGGAAPYYYADLNNSGSVSSADALELNRIIGGDSPINNATAAFASEYGNNGRSVGLGFAPLTPLEIVSIGTGSNRAGPDVNSVVFGFMEAGYSPRIAISRIGGVDANLPEVVFIRSRFTKSTGGFGLTEPITVTAATYQQAIDNNYLIFNTSATCTLTLLPAIGAQITGTINNGTNTAAGTTLTVTSVGGSSPLYVGQRLYAPEFGPSRQITITAFGTGSGGTGTYTVDTSLWVSCTRIFAPFAIPGTILRLKTTAAFAVNSASSNVVPLAGGAAGTAILPATAGKWCELVFDGTNWVIMAAN